MLPGETSLVYERKAEQRSRPPQQQEEKEEETE